MQQWRFINKFMINLTYDFHLHSCLSPCAEDDMTPANILGMASLIGLNAVALTDHNSCKNCEAFLAAAKQFHLLAIPGMELCTSEEVHVLCYFQTLQDAMGFDSYVTSQSADFQNVPSLFGNQLLYNAKDKLIGTEERLLIERTSISFLEAEEQVKKFHGICGPAHLDRTSNSLISNLGFIPSESHFSFAEITDEKKLTALKAVNPYLNHCEILVNSDAHSLEKINEPIHTLSLLDVSISSIFQKLEQIV